jgi:hypothetical protein
MGAKSKPDSAGGYFIPLWRGSSAGQSGGIIIRRSPVRSRPPLPAISLLSHTVLLHRGWANRARFDTFQSGLTAFVRRSFTAMSNAATTPRIFAFKSAPRA